MKKTEFIRRVHEMKNPVMSEWQPGRFCDLLQIQWHIADETPGERNFFYTPRVRLTNREYRTGGTLEPYYRRVEQARKKYNRWFQEAVVESHPLAVTR